MDRLKAIALCVVSVCALSVAVTAGASAAEFHASKVGGTLKGTQLNTQKFKVTGGTVECTKAATSGKTTALLAATQLVLVVYTSCTAFGLGASVTTVHIVLNANGTVSIGNDITITVPAASCTILIAPPNNSNLTSVIFKNSAGKLIEESAVTGITYTSSGGTCGASGSNGTYTGNNDVELVGGTLGWA